MLRFFLLCPAEDREKEEEEQGVERIADLRSLGGSRGAVAPCKQKRVY